MTNTILFPIFLYYIRKQSSRHYTSARSHLYRSPHTHVHFRRFMISYIYRQFSSLKVTGNSDFLSTRMRINYLFSRLRHSRNRNTKSLGIGNDIVHTKNDSSSLGIKVSRASTDVSEEQLEGLNAGYGADSQLPASNQGPSHVEKTRLSAVKTLENNFNFDVKHYVDGVDHEWVTAKSFQAFIKNVYTAKEQASKTILIRAFNKSSLEKVHRQCEKIGPIESLDWLYEGSDQTQGRLANIMAFVQFDSKEAVSNLLSEYSPRQLIQFIHCNPRLLKFVEKASKQSSKDAAYKSLAASNMARLSHPDKTRMKEEIVKYTKLDEIILALAKMTEMDELQIRLNYFMCQLVDDTMCGAFPNWSTLPHGSSLSSLACKGSDLDLVCHPTGLHMYGEYGGRAQEERSSKHSDFELYWGRIEKMEPRVFERSIISPVAFFLRYFLGCVELEPIPNARVPIVRFSNVLLSTRSDIQVDLSCNASVVSSYVLHELSSLDQRLKPLVLALRIWAKSHGLTSPEPGPFMTNFVFTHMMVFFFQKLKLLPPTDKILQGSHTEAIKDNRCDLANSSNLGELYLEFFHFWCTFDYDQIIDIRTGTSFANNTSTSQEFKSPLKILNTMSPQLNIARRASADLLQQFINQATISRKTLLQPNVVHSFLKCYKLG